MNQSSLIQKAEAFVKERQGMEATGHDWWHIQRVRNSARAICATEAADPFIVDLAVILHDVGDRKVLRTEEDDHSIARRFLESAGADADTIERVMFIIENMSFSKTLNTRRADASLEFWVVQDADRLDAIGAIGIARVFAFGGSRSRPLYDPTKEAQDIASGAEYKKQESSSFHHFYEKLLLLKDLMNTASARRIADERHAYMEAYMQQFLAEWDGKR